jgi:small subunit ribosomal protein S1
MLQHQRTENVQHMTQDNAMEPEDTHNPYDQAFENGSEMEQFDDLMSNYLDSMSDLEVGQLTKATIVEIGKDQVLLDVGDKAEGVCPLKEFQDFHGNLLVHPGEEVDVVIESRDSETGQVNVSYRKARQRAEWNRVVEAFEKGNTVYGQVTRALKNGVLVDVGIPCFLPGSQIKLTRVDNLESLVGETMECYIIDLDRQRRRGVLSRRRLLAEEQTKKKAELLATLEEGQTTEGRVKSVVDFGVFIDLGAIDGLVPREEVAWEKRVNVSDALKTDTRYKFKILSVDRERARVTLSRRQLKPDPWLTIEDDYPAEIKINGTITNLTNNCAYVVLADGIEGRIHRDNLSWLPSIKKPSDLLKKNEEVQALVLGYDKDKRLLDLGLKQSAEDPWADIDSRFPINSKHTVTISDVVSFGAFAKVDEFTKGLIHLTDMTHDRSIKDPRKVVKPGDEVEVVVTKIDKKNRRLNFGMKQLQEDPFTAYVKAHPQGSTVTGTVKNVSSFGAFVELAPLVEGLLHVSQWGREKVESMESVVKPGDEVTSKITKIEKKDRKISLSRRTLLQEEERKVVEQYKKVDGATAANTNLGSLLKGLDIKVKQ